MEKERRRGCRGIGRGEKLTRTAIKEAEQHGARACERAGEPSIHARENGTVGGSCVIVECSQGMGRLARGLIENITSFTSSFSALCSAILRLGYLLARIPSSISLARWHCCSLCLRSASPCVVVTIVN
eukprot:3489834-Rhodomonas_salina.2